VFLDFAPSLVVEILSPATALKDRHTKYEIYQQQQIPYYLIVDIDSKKVEVHKLESENTYIKQEVNQQEPFTFSLTDCQFTIVFDAIWS